MGRFKPYDYSQGLLIPVSFEEQLMPGTLEFAINRLVEKHLDLSIFDGKYKNDETGRLAYDPKILLKVVLLGYSRGLVSSRKIEQACGENIVFMAISCGQCPDHSTIATFVSAMKDEILPLFRNILLVCEEMDLLGGTLFALDGCELSSNASKQWSGSVDDLKRKKDKLEEKVKQLLKEQEKEDWKDDDPPPSGGNREKQIEKLEKQAKRIDEWLKEDRTRKGTSGRVIKSNVTDNESAKMLTSHGTLQGYNSQVLVDAKRQVIIHGEAFGNGQDHGHASPMIDAAKENMEQIGHSEEYFKDKTFTADSNYHSNLNLKKCVDEKIDAYIPDRWFRTRDPRFTNRKKYVPQGRKYFALEDFRYNQEKDQYVCPNGKNLGLKVKRIAITGNVYRQYRGNEEDCNGCDLKGRCVRNNGKGPRTLMVPIGPDGVNLSKLMVEKIESEKGQRIYPLRIAIVEPVFANLRTNKRLDRFTLRGKVKVNIQWLLYCMVHNIEKLTNYGFA